MKKCPLPASLERKTGFEPATLTWGKVFEFVQGVQANPLNWPPVHGTSTESVRTRPCCRAVYYKVVPIQRRAGLWIFEFTGRGVAALTNLHSIDDEPDNQSDDDEVEHHLNGDKDPGGLCLGGGVAEAHRGEGSR